MAVLFKNIKVLDESFNFLENRNVIVEGNRIVYIGESSANDAVVFSGYDFAKTIEGKGKLLMPGFYNIHSHLAMSLLRGYAEDMKLQEWLFDNILPFEAKLNSEDIYWGTKLCIAESLRFGIVSSTDMYVDAVANSEAVKETGFKADLALIAANGLPNFPYPFPSADDILKRNHGFDDGRLKFDAYVHAEYTTEESFVRQVAEYAKENGLNIHLHLSETKSEHEECKKRRNGRTPAEYFNDCGIFESPVTAAHCVWVERGDMEIFRKKGVTVAANPISNLKLASGIAPIKEMLDMGINIGIGTDGVSSNNNLNMLEEIKIFSLLQKIKTDNSLAVTTVDVMRAATVNGAKSQGRFDCGSIKVGNRADLIVLDVDKPYMYPQHNLLSNVVYSAIGTDVVLTMVDGKILYDDGCYTTLDLAETVRQVEQRRKRITSEL